VEEKVAVLVSAKQWQEHDNRRERREGYTYENASVGGASTKESERNPEQHVNIISEMSDIFWGGEWKQEKKHGSRKRKVLYTTKTILTRRSAIVKFIVAKFSLPPSSPKRLPRVGSLETKKTPMCV
jgi:hypothetical protein